LHTTHAMAVSARAPATARAAAAARPMPVGEYDAHLPGRRVGLRAKSSQARASLLKQNKTCGAHSLSSPLLPPLLSLNTQKQIGLGARGLAIRAQRKNVDKVRTTERSNERPDWVGASLGASGRSLSFLSLS
jgi:hypothetical protein